MIERSNPAEPGAILLATLIDIQNRDGDTNPQFAARLGISTSMWIYTKAGHRTLGPKIVQGIMRAFPHLRQLAVAFFVAADMTPSVRRKSTGTAP